METNANDPSPMDSQGSPQPTPATDEPDGKEGSAEEEVASTCLAVPQPSATDRKGSEASSGKKGKARKKAVIGILALAAIAGSALLRGNDILIELKGGTPQEKRARRLQDASVMVRVSETDYIRLDASEVTLERFRECVHAGACKAENFATREENPLCNYDASGKAEDRLLHPMNCVNAAGAREYCAWRGKSLPDNMEWNTYIPIYMSDERRDHPLQDEQDGQGKPPSKRPEGIYTSIVGSDPGNDGLHLVDMYGNVREWTELLPDADGPSAKPRGYAFWSNDDEEEAEEEAERHLGKALEGVKKESIGFRCVQR